MVFKALGGKKASLAYQLANPTAKVLRGEPSLTQSLISSVPFSQRYCGFVLSFEEEDLPPAIENQTLDAFLALVRGGLSEERVSATVIKHSDKRNATTGAQRVDYHITVPEIELISGHKFSPYHYRRDRKLFYAWERMTNVEHGFTRPDDPARRHTTNIPRRLSANRKELTAAIDTALCAEVTAGRITNRGEVVAFLRESGFVITREGASYVTIADAEDNRLRLKGKLYDIGFTTKKPSEGAGGPGASRDRELAELRKQVAELYQRRVDNFAKRYRTGGHRPSPSHTPGDMFSPDCSPGFVRDARGGDDPPLVNRREAGPREAGAGRESGPARSLAGKPMGAEGEAILDSGPNLRRIETQGVNREIATNRTGRAHDGQFYELLGRARRSAHGLGAAGDELAGAGVGLAAAARHLAELVVAAERTIAFACRPLDQLIGGLIRRVVRRQRQQLSPDLSQTFTPPSLR